MFKKVLEYAGPYRKLTYMAAAVMVAGIVMSVLPYWFLYRVIAAILSGRTVDAAMVAETAGASAACLIIYSVLYVNGLSLSHRAAYHTLEGLRVSLQGKMEGLPLGSIQEKGVGTLKKVFIDDIESIELLLAHAVPEGIANVSVPVIIFAAMFLADWKLALLALGSLPLGILAMGMMYRTGKSKMGDYYASAKRMNNTIVEYINGMEVVKVFNRDGESYRRFETDVRDYRDFTLAWFKACWPWMAAYTSVLPCTALFLLPVGSWMVIQGYSSLEDLALTLCMSFGIGGPLVKAVGFMSAMPQINYKIDQLEGIFREPPLVQTDAPFSGTDHTVRFENVCFSYGEEEVLHQVSLTVPEGSMTALVGESGSGKSTLAKLLVHLYDTDGGTVTLGGQDIREMSLEALNRQISFVSQEQFLFNTTLRENIRMGRPEASDEEVMEAARRAQCMEFLERLENGIDTMAGDGGKQLSGGERQRISLARAILKDAPVVVLDEATAFIDPENEEKMNKAIAQVIRRKTVIVIAHRLYTIMNADQICVMEKGRITASGRHGELLKSCRTYRELWQAAKSSSMWKVGINGTESEMGEVCGE